MGSAKLLATMLNELSECLGSASESSASPNPSELLIHERMRNVMSILLEECININTGVLPPFGCVHEGMMPLLHVLTSRPRTVIPQSSKRTWWCC